MPEFVTESAVGFDEISAFRAFNRFYTRRIGVLNDSMHDSDFSLSEARVIYELGTQAPIKAQALAEALGMDKAQLSRVLARLKRQALVASKVDISDKRAAQLTLTIKGQKAFESLDNKSSEQAAQMLMALSAADRQRLLADFADINALLIDGGQKPEVNLRTPELGDLGVLISRQAIVYHQQFGWNQDFEALIARIYAEYHEAPAEKKALWIAELDGRMAGSIFVLPAKDDPKIAQLRMLYVEPFARGQGIGQKLVNEVIKFARAKGFKSVMLWTQDCLTSARRIYQGAGFTLAKEDRHYSFGQDLNGQYWTLDL